MNQLTTQFNQIQEQPSGVIAKAASSREMEEVKGQIFMARQFPRNVFLAEQRIRDACKRQSLAETAIYRYPRGGAMVEGPSIRLAEVLAQNWGNIAFGVKELEQREGESIAMAYAWDLETNVRQEKVFTVKHTRKAKGQIKKLDDPRDIYEMVANQGARRLRSCILGIIPGDIVEMAIDECQKTLTGNNKEPLKDRIAKALKTFKEKFRVTQEMIEERFGYKADAFTEYDYLELIKIFNSLKDGMSKVEDWFDKGVQKKEKSGLAAAFNGKEQEEVKADENKDEAEPKQEELPLE
ncbi:hypothetical protein ACTHHL_04030 [Aeribacillus composti]|mgnify:CR=1 FL=1|uniref:hypothetical protein n=1 Tax=Aeribacillus composti TaxID=1868734 RepID=UPI00406A594A